MSHFRFTSLLLPFAACGIAPAQTFRPPAVPLVTFDPYLSIWSEADKLGDDSTRHWTGHRQALDSLIQIDGANYRIMGADPGDLPALTQIGVLVGPTRTVYRFKDHTLDMTVTFTTAALPDDLNALTRPVGYIEWNVKSIDGRNHRIQILATASSQLAVNDPKQVVDWSRETMGRLTALTAGTVEQPILRRMGDDTRIDWGYAYLAAQSGPTTTNKIGGLDGVIDEFSRTGGLNDKIDRSGPRAANKDEPTLAFAFDLGQVGAEPVSRRAMVAYDEIYSIDYFGQRLRPYWRRNGATPNQMLQAADRDYESLAKRCEAFDAELGADLEQAGGERYRQVASLAYRQFLAATGIAADSNGQPLLFTKENTSNGDIATVDVIFPMAPALILLSPGLAKASIVPVLSYAASSHWKFPNAPHDLGTYPVAMGRDDGGEGMPVEESGNLLILCDAICHEDGNPNFVAKWWPQLSQWATYLERFGLDPEDQLCTDDFMGHLAHNSNLSIKAIVALAAFGDMARMRGDQATADRFASLAKTDANHWLQVADAGDRSLLAFDKPNTWSQKYNLVWDRILGLNVFPASVAAREVAYYKSVLQPFGVPLDSRTRLTKTDWSMWSATLATDRSDFEALVSPIWDYLNQTTSRVPLVDSYVTNDLNSDGMHARPVVGGLFIKALADPALWDKWSKRGWNAAGDWAELPKPPTLVGVVAISQGWKYTTAKPPRGWESPAYDDSAWQIGSAPFGTEGTPAINPKTEWKSDDIWIRRKVRIPPGSYRNLKLLVFHDEDVEIYIDGVPAASESGYLVSYRPLDIANRAKALLKPGSTVEIAAHCHQTDGGQGIDIGIVDQR